MMIIIFSQQKKLKRKKMMPFSYYAYYFNPYFTFSQVENINLPFHTTKSEQGEIFATASPHIQTKRAQKSFPQRQTIPNEISDYEPKGNSIKSKTCNDNSNFFSKQNKIPISNKLNMKIKQAKPRLQNQKQGRNANSNLLRMFFRTLEQTFSNDYINNIIFKNKIKTNFRNFSEWFQINKAEHKNYIRLPSVKKLFVGKRKDDQNTKIMRILLNDFLRQEAHSYYLTSKKIKKSMMSHNLNSIRVILKEITQSQSDP